MKVLVVGGGLSGSMLCYLMRNTAAQITCWDKSRGLGGRAATKRGNAAGQQADTGLQYLTKYKASSQNSVLYKSLIDSKVIAPFQITNIENCRPDSLKLEHFVATNGASQLAKHFMAESKATVSLDTRLSKIEVADEKTTVFTTNGENETFDLVLITIPVPQFLRDISISPPISPASLSKLSQVKYSTRFALICFFGEEVPIPSDYAAGYLSSGSLRYWSMDGRKRGVKTNSSLIFHTRTDFHPEVTKEEALPFMLAELKESFPDLPQPKQTIPHKWLYSQTVNSMPDNPGFHFINDTVGLFGDGFVDMANFDGCVESASKLSEHILQNFNF